MIPLIISLIMILIIHYSTFGLEISTFSCSTDIFFFIITVILLNYFTYLFASDIIYSKKIFYKEPQYVEINEDNNGRLQIYSNYGKQIINCSLTKVNIQKLTEQEWLEFYQQDPFLEQRFTKVFPVYIEIPIKTRKITHSKIQNAKNIYFTFPKLWLNKCERLRFDKQKQIQIITI